MSKFYIPNDLGEKDCPDCNGYGLQGGGEDYNFITECTTCEGTGKVPRTEQDAWDDYVHECESKYERNNGK